MSTMTSPSLTGPDPRLLNRIGWWVMLVLAVLASAHAFSFVVFNDALFGQESGQHERMFQIPAIGAAHTLGGAVAMLIGPFQFLTSLRRKFPRVHVWLGRTYLTVVGLSALAGLYLSPGSLARDTFGIAFIFLALAWLYTGTQAYLTIRRRDIEAHKRWMIRNYALTYAAVTLRVEMPFLILAFGVAPIMALNIVGWTCWVPNLAVVEWFMRRRPQAARR